MTPRDTSAMPESELNLAQFVRTRRDLIVSRFVTEVQRKDLRPPGVSAPFLINHIPRFLDEIAEEAARLDPVRASQDAIDTSETARAHGEQRWSLGYDLEALIREYGVLRHCVIAAAKEENVRISVDEFEILAKCLSVGVAEAATAYAAYRDEELRAERANLAFLAEAGQLLGSSLDYRSTLSRLTSLIVPRLADCCVIHLEGTDAQEAPTAHVDPARVELVRELYRRFPSPPDSAHGYPAVLRTGQPELVEDIEPGALESVAQNAEHLALLQQLDLGSWLVVPLSVQGGRLGALVLMNGRSRRRYTEQDLVLATELARRAAVAIDNARLYELSQQERSRVEAATRIKDEFVAIVSHELRTPLNAILGWIHLMRSGSLDEATRTHAFEVIERNAEAEGRLVADLLDTTHILTGRMRINPSQVDLSDVIDRVVQGLRPATDAKRLRVEVHIEKDTAVLRGDGERLQQVVWNLVANAVKFTPKDGLVRLQLRRIDSDLELTVTDDGAGIEARFLPHVFESFRQSDGSMSRPHSGLGIGLSIAKHIVELHGGDIEARSDGPGRGSTFVVRLPISPLVSTTLGVSRVPATRTPSPADPIPSATAGLKVLVVDDEPDARELVAYVLESSGMEVRTAGSSAEAMKVLEDYTPHVLLSDVGMPEEDGYSLIRNIRTMADESKKRVPAIALTAFARSEDRTRALLAGFNVHMAKPVEPSALVKAVIELAGDPRP
jgi:signal transduction histidine kinase/CheY-like chemotaxis protein